MPNYVSEELNRICTNAGVQLTVTMDPRDFKKAFQFQNFGNDTVKISHGEFYFFLRPTEIKQIKTVDNKDPKITRWFVQYERAT
jgi:hypothetical protein